MSMRIDTPDDESAIRQPPHNIPLWDVIRNSWQPPFYAKPNRQGLKTMAVPSTSYSKRH